MPSRKFAVAALVWASFASVTEAQTAQKSAATAIPRMPDGKPDLSGIWEGPFVNDMTKSLRNQQGSGPLALTEWGKEKKATQVDVSIRCLPSGYTRSTNAPFPLEIVQRPDRVVILYEMNNNFHIIFTDGRGHPADLEPTWAGHSIGKWEGDTLVVDTIGFNGKTQLDTEGNPHSDQLHLTERFTRTDATHMHYELTVDDPKTYPKPWKNVRTFTIYPDWELQEYVCNENNKSVSEGHVLNDGRAK